MFRSDRLREYSAGPNALAVAQGEILARGERVVNLVSGKMPPFPQDVLRAAMDEAEARAVVYAPDPLGRLDAREAIAAFYERNGVRFSPDRIFVTPGTSVSYLYVFSLLGEPGDEFLVPRPSYPLFDEIARIPGVRLVPYWLRESDGWRIDLEHLESQVSTRTRAVILISPHNPTGSVATDQEIAGLSEIARRHDLAVIVDEVFSEFVFDPRTLARPAVIGDAPLVLTLNGFSKMFSLPGWKVGWIAVSGDEERALKATWMLGHVADAFLPVNEWAQSAVPGIFARGADFPRGLREHAARGRDMALRALAVPGVTIVPPAGGFFLTARLAADGLDEEAVCLDLLRRERLLVHPGYFYDLPPDHLVLAYTAEETTLRPALDALRARLTPR